VAIERNLARPNVGVAQPGEAMLHYLKRVQRTGNRPLKTHKVTKHSRPIVGATRCAIAVGGPNLYSVSWVIPRLPT
jgi:hypothetical protein